MIEMTERIKQLRAEGRSNDEIRYIVLKEVMEDSKKRIAETEEKEKEVGMKEKIDFLKKEGYSYDEIVELYLDGIREKTRALARGKNPNPTKDQHFMVDESMIRKIAETADIHEGESIMEIGGGEGALTAYLALTGNPVTVVELDPFYAGVLREVYKDFSNVTVVEGNALDQDCSPYDRVVTNLPYTISEPFLINLARTGALNYDEKAYKKDTNVKSVTLVLGQNAVRKMVAPVQIVDGESKHANTEFGTMGAICKAFCDVDIASAIPSTCFYPEPATSSFLVNLTPKTKKTTVDRIIRACMVDKKGVYPTIGKTYGLMLSRGEVYKTTKYKNDYSKVSNAAGLTSAAIMEMNIYDLTNAQISQLFQDAVRNDQAVKANRAATKKKKKNRDTEFDFGIDDDYYDDDEILESVEDLEDVSVTFADDATVEELAFEDTAKDFEEAEDMVVKVKEKYTRIYDYLNDATAYNALLHRRLEDLPEEEFQAIINGDDGIEVPTMQVAQRKGKFKPKKEARLARKALREAGLLNDNNGMDMDMEAPKPLTKQEQKQERKEKQKQKELIRRQRRDSRRRA